MSGRLLNFLTVTSGIVSAFILDDREISEGQNGNETFVVVVVVVY